MLLEYCRGYADRALHEGIMKHIFHSIVSYMPSSVCEQYTRLSYGKYIDQLIYLMKTSGLHGKVEIGYKNGPT
jgi:hypothetical protein